MFDLLPPNATPAERALSEAMAQVDDVPVIVKEIWNADTAPSNVLPWLAWAFSVDDWDVNWTEQQKRNTIKGAVTSQRIKGTIGAVKKQLAALGIDIQVQEWFNQQPPGNPYTFKLIINSDKTDVTQIGIKKIIEIVNTNKNLRSHMDLISVTANSESIVYTGAVANIGTEITISSYDFIPAAVNDFNIAINNIRVL